MQNESPGSPNGSPNLLDKSDCGSFLYNMLMVVGLKEKSPEFRSPQVSTSVHGSRALSPLHHPCFLSLTKLMFKYYINFLS